jgi:hypothetical protein
VSSFALFTQQKVQKNKKICRVKVLNYSITFLLFFFLYILQNLCFTTIRLKPLKVRCLRTFYLLLHSESMFLIIRVFYAENYDSYKRVY